MPQLSKTGSKWRNQIMGALRVLPPSKDLPTILPAPRSRSESLWSRLTPIEINSIGFQRISTLYQLLPIKPPKLVDPKTSEFDGMETAPMV
jgi:hypothetical protein